MLKVLRDNLKYLSWILWVVIAVFVLFVFVDFGAGVPGGSRPNDAAATVGDEKVTFSEFQNRYRQAEELYRQAYGEQFTPELARQLRLPLQVLDQIVGEKLLLAEARRIGLAATDEEVRRRVLSFAAFKDGQGAFVGTEAYERTLRSSGYTPESFEAQVRSELLIDKLRSILAQNVYVTPAEVERALREETERASIRFVRLGPDRFAEQVDATDAEAQAYYDAHPDEFRRPEQRRVDYLLVDAARVREGLSLPDSDLEAYYDAHREEFTQREQVRARHILLEIGERRDEAAARAGIEAIRRRITGGEDFAALARELSEDAASKADGGDLGFFGRGRMVKEFEDAAFAAAPGELVGPVKSAFGIHLLEVIERREAGVRPFSEVRETVQNRLLAERGGAAAEEKARQLAERIRKEKLAGEDGFKRLAGEDKVLVYAAAGPFGRADLVPGIGRGTAFTTTAFDLAAGEVSGAVQVPRGWAVLQVKEVLAPRVPPFPEISAEARQAAERDKSLAVASGRLEAGRARLAAGASLEEVAAELGVQAQESGSFGPGGPVGTLGGNRAVAQAAFALSPGQTGGPVVTPDGAVLFQVTARERFDPSLLASRGETTRSALEGERVGKLLASLLERRRSEVGVTYNPSLLESLGLADGGGADRS